ncbi:39S ribosomal protein L50, mitochondrial [Tachyglossus aculeatus]|uniref:39S ribosomal protein L50, mitochondrial n=1 Tax=Tachyglossus aculeatus TaxID=9261 RepID=UPI0018F2953D|nr:39S ribosomal protein L50, mitochondrial [Tachyglossus aculeatus]
MSDTAVGFPKWSGSCRRRDYNTRDAPRPRAATSGNATRWSLFRLNLKEPSESLPVVGGVNSVPFALQDGGRRLAGRPLEAVGADGPRPTPEGFVGKEREPPVMETAEEVKEEPVLACPPPPSRKYLPPEDLESRLESLVKEVFGASLPADWRKTTLEKSQLKFHLLAQLAEELGHPVPNSRLHQMNSAQDVLAFYSIPVQDQSKFDELCSSELPANLKITWEY